MNRVVLIGFLLLACPGEGPPATSTRTTSPVTKQPTLPPNSPPKGDDPACGTSLLDEGCGDDIALCVEPVQPESASEHP